MSDPWESSKEVYSIVVLGAMNPRIHHPWWYKFVGILSDDEAKEAMDGELVINPEASAFSTGSLRISSSLNRWEVLTVERISRDRILKIAVDVFDTHLQQTPIRQLATNNDRLLVLPVKDVATAIGGIIVEKGLGISGMTPSKAEFQFTVPDLSGAETTIRVESTKTPSRVFIRVNANFRANPDLAAENKPIASSFLIGEALRQRFESDYVKAEKYMQKIRAALSGQEGESDGG